MYDKNAFCYITLGSVQNSVLMLPAFSELFDFAQPCLEKQYNHTMQT